MSAATLTRPDRDVVCAELVRLAELHDGVIEPKQVVAAARPVKSPLHPCFDWDDKVASESWRLHQARNLIRVMVIYDARIQAEHRVFVSLTTDRQEREHGGYRITTEVMTDAEMRAQLLGDAREEMKRFAAKYRHLTELAEVIRAMDVAV